jgi:type IV secretory pathway TrbF-like protein
MATHMATDVVPTVGSPNGHALPTLPPELEAFPAMIEAVVRQTKADLDARDASAEQHAWLWHRFALWLGGLLCGALLIVAWLVYERRDVQAFVQVVQMDEGRLVQIGVPQKLLDYTPPDAPYMDMLAEWLRRVYWRGDDVAKAELHDWRWVELHTCPSARPFLAGLKAKQKPGKKVTTRVQVNITSITKTPTPKSYQVLWEQVTTGTDAKGKAAQFTTTFTVGRLALKTLADAEDNRLGICVSSFDTAENAT